MKVTYATWETEFRPYSALYFEGEIVFDDKGGIGRDFIFQELIRDGRAVTEYEEVEVWEMPEDGRWPELESDLITTEEMCVPIEKGYALTLQDAFTLDRMATEAGLDTSVEANEVVVLGPKWRVEKFDREWRKWKHDTDYRTTIARPAG